MTNARLHAFLEHCIENSLHAAAGSRSPSGPLGDRRHVSTRRRIDARADVSGFRARFGSTQAQPKWEIPVGAN